MERENEIKNMVENNLNEANEIQLVDLAVSLSDYEDEELEKLCTELSDENLAKVLEEADIKVQKKIINFLDNSRVIEIFSFMSKDDIVDVLGILNIGKRKQLINIMKVGDKAIIKELLGYKDDSAGRNNDNRIYCFISKLNSKRCNEKNKRNKILQKKILYMLSQN